MDKYLETMVGKKKAAEIMRAVKTGKPIMVTGNQQTGKTTLCNYINSIGGNAAEDFNICIVTLEKPLDCMTPNFLETLKPEIKDVQDEKSILRRFTVIGTKDEMDKLYSLVECKSLSREDLAVVLNAIKLNPDIS